MSKIKQIVPVPQGRKYYAVYRDKNSNSGFVAERLDYLVLVKGEFDYSYVEGLTGYTELASIYNNYYGTFSEDALKCELPELWEEMMSSGLFQDEPSPLEKFIVEQRDRLNYQSRQIDLLKEKIAELEKGRLYTEQREFNGADLPREGEKTPADLTDDRSEISGTQTNNENARDIILPDLRSCRGKKLDIGTIKALSASGMKTLGDVADKTFDELLQIKHIGKAAMDKIFAVLKSRGLTLKDENSAYLKSAVKLKAEGKTLTEISDELDISANLTAKYLKYGWRDLRNLIKRQIT